MHRAALLLLAVGAATVARAGEPADLGRTLFQTGHRPDGSALAAVAGTAGLPLPVSFAACARCHGDDARGRTEGGVTAGDIRAATLTTPYAVALDTGRRRPPYDAAGFATALTRGIDPAGQPLDPAMPRYVLSPSEAAALFAYLGGIDATAATGVDATTIRIGFLPPDDPALAAATERVLRARFAEINAAGGVFRRQLVLVPQAREGVLALLDDNLASPARSAPTHPVALHAVRTTPSDGDRASFCLFATPPDLSFSLLSEDARTTYFRCLGSAPASATESFHQLTLLAATDLLVEALARAGRVLTAPRLIAALESTGTYRSGFGFLGGFTPDRHVATGGPAATPPTLTTR